MHQAPALDRRRALLAICGSLAAARVPAEQPAPAILGWHFLARLDVGSQDAMGQRQEPSILTRTQALGPRARAEVLQGDDDWRPGDFALTEDGGRSLLVYDLASRRVERLTPDTLEHGADAAAGLMKFKLRDLDIGVRRIGPGGRVAGMATTHWRIERRLRAQASLLFFKESLSLSDKLDFWFADEFADTANPLAALTLSLASVMLRLTPQSRAKHRAALDELPGLNPVRLHCELSTEDSDGRSTNTLAVEVTEPKRTAIDAGMFAAPTGFASA
ncbi:hypothetical protein PO768_08310 [Paucibacter sp. XJ19-41]|nr:hypothetical protein [Paucibacter sp. XJ19-41]